MVCTLCRQTCRLLLICVAGHAAHYLRTSSDLDGSHSGGSGGLGGRTYSGDGAPPVPLPLPPEHLFTCTVGRNRSQARCAP